MDDDWGLYAVVRGCAAIMGRRPRLSSPTTAPVAAAVTDNPPFPSFPPDLCPFQDDQNPFDFLAGLVDDRENPFMGTLQDIYHGFLYGVQKPPPNTADISAAIVMPVAPPTLVAQPHQDFTQIEPAPLQLNAQIQENAQFVSSPTPQPTVRAARRRKNQPSKMVHELTQEELSADSWAWRKYGQKPIKGSPHPRHYYRCSTSKGCAARKQVELSATIPDTYVVSYSGEHTHPRPIQRSSLAGITRGSRMGASASGKRGGGNRKSSLKSSAASPAAGASFSPATPSMEVEAAALNDVDVQMADVFDGAGYDYDGDSLMITNDLLNDDVDIFRCFQDFSDDHDSSGCGELMFSSGFMSSPPWTPTSSAGNAGTFNFNGGGGD